MGEVGFSTATIEGYLWAAFLIILLWLRLRGRWDWPFFGRLPMLLAIAFSLGLFVTGLIAFFTLSAPVIDVASEIAPELYP